VNRWVTNVDNAHFSPEFPAGRRMQGNRGSMSDGVPLNRQCVLGFLRHRVKSSTAWPLFIQPNRDVTFHGPRSRPVASTTRQRAVIRWRRMVITPASSLGEFFFIRRMRFCSSQAQRFTSWRHRKPNVGRFLVLRECGTFRAIRGFYGKWRLRLQPEPTS